MNFRDLKASTIELVYPQSVQLFDSIEDTIELEVFNPDTLENRQYGLKLLQDPGVSIEDMSKEQYVDLYKPLVEGTGQVLLFNSNKRPNIILKKIANSARVFMEETGINMAHMAFGFVHWRESDISDTVFRAPLVLVPIKITQESAAAPFVLTLQKDEAILNPTFSYKLSAEQIATLPDYEEAGAQHGLQAYLEQVKEAVAALNWSVSAECKIALFSSQTINMYSDLKNHADLVLQNNNVRLLLGQKLPSEALFKDNALSGYDNPLVDFANVVDADSSQLEAIAMAKAGHSFVLQGPPGTGKSQTITNIIAECLRDGKKILFVSEKMAALNIVYENLKRVGLDDFCLELHSHKADKKTFVTELCRSMLLSSNTHVEALNYRAIMQRKLKYQNKLDAYAQALHTQNSMLNLSLFELYNAYTQYQDAPEVDFVLPEAVYQDEISLLHIEELLEQYVQFSALIGADYKRHPWYGYSKLESTYLEKTQLKTHLELAITLLEALESCYSQLSRSFAIKCDDPEQLTMWSAIFELLASSSLMTPQLFNRATFESVCSQLCLLQDQAQALKHTKEILDAQFDDGIYQLDGAHMHKQLTKQFSAWMSRQFNAEYKDLIKKLEFCQLANHKISYEQAVELTKHIANYHKQYDSFKSLDLEVKDLVGPVYKGMNTNWGELYLQVDKISHVLFSGEVAKANLSLGNLPLLHSFENHKEAFANLSVSLARAHASFDLTILVAIEECFEPGFLQLSQYPFTSNIGRLKDYLASWDKLDSWCHFKVLLDKLRDWQLLDFIDKSIEQHLESSNLIPAFKKQFYHQWIFAFWSSSQALTVFNRIAHDQDVAKFSEQDLDGFALSRQYIRKSLLSARPDFYHASGKKHAQLQLLLSENERKRRRKSIRTLLKLSGAAIQDIKPCFMMSPLSVSTFLDPKSLNFDMVIFDEASQIFPQDAIGSIYRAQQLIVVGDTKQMPPQNFFKSTVGGDDYDEDEDDLTNNAQDFESILDLCSACLPQQRLRWHYRSRYEQLIAFSNYNFYDNALITFPSAKAQELDSGVDFYHVDGCYDRKARVNQSEAEQVVELIFQHIADHPERSLGVVAFNQSQQNLIENLLSKRRQEQTEHETFFSHNVPEPFFIKNLETVQGDERDTIIFSIAYARNQQGTLIYNFGPLNRQGGERRLNVAFTRAKYNIKLVSSLYYSDLDLSHSKAEGVRLLREYLEYAQKGSLDLEGMSDMQRPSSQGGLSSYVEQEVCDFLRAQGYQVDTKLGFSGFKIDMGLKAPEGGDYVLAIECDGYNYAQAGNVRDRDRLRQNILERMGWQFYRIWSTEWLKHKDVEQQLLLEAVAAALKHYQQERLVQEQLVLERAERQALLEQHKLAEDEETSIEQHVAMDSEFELAVYEFLHSQGVILKSQVECAGYRIDLVVCDPKSKAYVLAIECDGATYHSSKAARDHDEIRQSVLEEQGWKFYRIWSTDWFNAPQEAQAKLMAAVNTALTNYQQVQLTKELQAQALKLQEQERLQREQALKLQEQELLQREQALKLQEQEQLQREQALKLQEQERQQQAHALKLQEQKIQNEKAQMEAFFKFQAQMQALSGKNPWDLGTIAPTPTANPVAMEAPAPAPASAASPEPVTASGNVAVAVLPDPAKENKAASQGNDETITDITSDVQVLSDVFNLLSSMGLPVQSKLNCLGYVFDLVIESPQSHEYALLINLHPDKAKQNLAREQAWNLYELDVTLWQQDKVKAKQQLLSRLHQVLPPSKETQSAELKPTQKSTEQASLEASKNPNQKAVVAPQAKSAPVKTKEIAKRKSPKPNQTLSYDVLLKREVANFLVQENYTLASQVKCAGYVVDFAIQRANSKEYAIAINCGQEEHYAQEHYVMKDELRQHGIKYYRVYPNEWFGNKLVEQKRLLDEIKSALQVKRTPSAAPVAPASALNSTKLERCVSESAAKSSLASAPLKDKESKSTAILNSMSNYNAYSYNAEAIKAEAKRARASKISPACEEGFKEQEHLKSSKGSPAHKAAILEQDYDGSEYQLLDVLSLCKSYMPMRFVPMLQVILQKEAPLSEEFLLRRMLDYFKRKKITDDLKRTFNQWLQISESVGVERRDGFLYLKNKPHIHFRKATHESSKEIRDIKYIAIEELAAGLVYVLQHYNTYPGSSMERDKVYKMLGSLCGVYRIGRDIRQRFEQALQYAVAQQQIEVRQGCLLKLTAPAHKSSKAKR